MRILFLSTWFPWPPNNGSRTRVYSLIKYLARRHEISLLAFAHEPVSAEQLAQMGSLCRVVHTVPYREFHPGGIKALLGLFSFRPRDVVDTYSPEMAALVRQIAAAASFDVALASEMRTAPYTLLQGAPCVLEDVELSVIYERFAAEHRPLPRMRHGLTWHKLVGYLRRLLRASAGCTVVSDRERDLLARIAPQYRQVAVVPNGVDLEMNTGNFGTVEPATLIYSGALTYGANLDAMQFFVRDIWPVIQSRHGDARLRITGRYQGVPAESLPVAEGVELTGYLEDIRPAVAQSWACVVPLRVGSGTRLKILEAMALGTPVVSTSKGAEGLAVTPGQDILIADEPQAFAEAVLRLFHDPLLRAHLSTNARRLVEERYSWEQSAARLEQLCQEAVGLVCP